MITNSRAATALTSSVLIGLTAVFVPTPTQAAPAGPVINEVYARGGSANQPYRTKFVELYNTSDDAVTLSGYGLGYSAATNAGIGQTCALSGTIPAGGYFVVTVGSNGTTGAAVDGQQNCGNINPSGTAGAYTLLRDGSTVDLVGWGTATRNETAAASYPGGNSNPGSISRQPDGADSDNNQVDFVFTEMPTPGATNGGTVDPPDDPPGPATLTIAEIQGTGKFSPVDGQKVSTRGVVTAAYSTGGFSGVYLQTPGTGGTPKTVGDASDGIFLYSSWASRNLSIGQCVDVADSTAKEYATPTNDPVSWLTELDGGFVTAVPEGCAPVTATPLATLPATDAEREVYEGMLVHPQGTYTITDNYDLNQFGQLGLVFGTEPLYTATEVVAPGPEAVAYEAANQQRMILLDDGSSWNYMTNNTAKWSPLPYLSAETPRRTGSQLDFIAPVILDDRHGWNLQPTSQVVGADHPAIPITSENDREATPPAVGGGAQLAAFNVLNYFTDLGMDEAGCRYYADMYGDPVATNRCEVRGAWSAEAFADQKAKIVAAINSMDAEVVALMEIENSAGITYIDHHRDYTLAELVGELNGAAGYTRWAYASSPVVTPGTEDVIRVAFIYDPNVVQALGSSLIDLDPAFANARYPLAQKFKIRRSGKPFVMIANHFKSKGSGDDDGTGQGLSNPSREAQSTQLTAWAKEMFDDQAQFLVGDFNAYSRETPVQIIESAGFANVAKLYEPMSATYQFGGRLGSLDHVFANAKAMQLVTGAGVWDINADESIAFQYSRRNYNIADFYSPDQYASSDHDPVLVGIATTK